MRMTPYYLRLVLIGSLTCSIIGAYAVPHLLVPACQRFGILFSPVEEVLITWILFFPLMMTFTRLTLQMRGHH